MIFFESILLLSNGIKSFTENCLKELRADQKQIEKHLEENLMIVTNLVSIIGYDKAAEIAKKAYETGKTIKEAIFAFSGGTKSLLIKGEGEEISTAVEVAEIVRNRMYPSVEIENVSLGSRPYFERRQQGNYRRNNDFRKNNSNNRNKKDLISKIEITISKSKI